MRTAFKRILILCEGQTEYQYAKALKQELPRAVQRNFEIDIDIHKKNDPLNLAKEAKKRVAKSRRDKNEYDDIWLFFDNDNQKKLKEAFVLIAKEGFRFAYSSISIEYWFILHFEENGRSFRDAKEAIHYLKKLWPEYHKTKINHWALLKNDYNIARDRASKVMKKYENITELHILNPYSNIEELIDYVKQYC